MESKVSEAPEVKLHFLDYWRIIRIRKMVILAVFLLVVLTTTVVSFFLPKSYSSTARIAVEKDATDVDSPLAGRSIAAGYDPFWIQTQFEKIRSSMVLNDVVRKLQLNVKWAKEINDGIQLRPEEALMFLQNHLKVQPYRNTSIIEITYRGRNKEEAADIANAVSEAYRESRMAIRRELKLNGIKVLESQLDSKNDEIALHQAAINDLRRENNITELMESTIGAASGTLPLETLRRNEQLRIEARAEYEQFDTQLEKLKQLSRSEMRMAMSTAVFPPDQHLVTLMQDWTLSQQKLVALLGDFSPEHPEVKRAQKVVDLLDDQINQKVNGILLGLETKVAYAKARLDNYQTEVDRAQKQQTELAAKYQPYFDAKREMENSMRVREALKIKIEGERMEANLPISTAVEIIDRATPAIKQSFPNLTLNIALGVVVGLIVGIALAFFIEYLDTSVKTIDDVERALQAPVLGVIPQDVSPIIYEGPESPHAEAYRVLRTQILFSRKDESFNTVTVVSGGVGEGKSTTLINLATIFAHSGDRVLVVDSDLRRPTLHKVLRVSNSIGLTNCLLGQNRLEEAIQTTPLETLHFLPSGKLPSSSMGILSSSQMKVLIQELKQRYDWVFFDSPPIMGVSDASVLVSEVDMTVQVVQFRRYPQPMTLRAKQTIEKVGGNLLGIVLNNINVSQDENYYYYYSGYAEYSKQNDSDTVKSKA
jgi:succinoglycan biosynthesis transport protein ExoP